ncbi:MAG: 4Fe-4S binding protein, partial [Spirochaetaceae bacterium]|nr:4Fe-4S binding protein [Spirochaetaceae bacterium]
MKTTKRIKDTYIAINKRRQRIRIGLMLIWVVLMPVTLYYFSPYLPFMGLMEGIIAGSVFVFAAQFFISIFWGRLFCGWICPAGAVQNFSFSANPNKVNRSKLQWIKFALWVPWLAAWISLALSAAGLKESPLEPDFFYQLKYGISISNPGAYIIYLFVLTLILLLSLVLGRYGFCHTSCWMSPFMVIGQMLGVLLRLPGLFIKSSVNKCTSCGSCSDVCPMSLDMA